MIIYSQFNIAIVCLSVYIFLAADQNLLYKRWAHNLYNFLLNAGGLVHEKNLQKWARKAFATLVFQY
jgi:hypothetical protein